MALTILAGSSYCPAASVVKIMPLGDSITRGWYGSMDRWGYRKPLYDSLSNAGISFELVGSRADGNFAEPFHEGHDGWRADEILNGRASEPNAGKLVNWLYTYQPDIVLLHIGTNDVTAGNQDANEVNAILDVVDDYEVQSGKGVTVMLALIINRWPYIAATTAYNSDINVMASNRIAGGDSIVIVNMETALSYPDDLTDNLHPNDSGYAKMADVWFSVLNNDTKSRIEEVNGRLELTTQDRMISLPAFYAANGWKLDTARDFAVKVDFNYSGVSLAEGWIGMNIGDDANYVSISVGSDGYQSYYYYEAVIEGKLDYEKEPRGDYDGTLYISYAAATKNFFLSHTGFGIENACVFTTRGQWSAPVNFLLGGGSFGAAIGPGEAYLDNFEMKHAGLVDWPPATDIDQSGFIELYDLAIMCENWLEAGEGDFDNNGVVDLLDLAEMGLAW